MIINATLSGVDTTATATAGDILASKTAWVNDEQITGTIPTKTASNLTASGATVTVPAGYYASQSTKSIANGSATTPATTITQSTPSLSVASSTGVVTASVAQKTQSVTPTVSAGYVSTGTAGTITLGASSGTLQLSTQAAKTVTPSESSQTAVAAGKYTTGAVTVAAIPSNYKPLSSTTAVAADIAKGKTAYNGSGTLLTGTKPVPLRSSPSPQIVSLHLNTETIGSYDEGWRCVLGDYWYASGYSNYYQRPLTSHFSSNTQMSSGAYWSGSSGYSTLSCFSGSDLYILNTYRKYKNSSLSLSYNFHKLTSSGLTTLTGSPASAWGSVFGTSGSGPTDYTPQFMQAINGVIYVIIWYTQSPYKYYMSKYTISSNSWTTPTEITALQGYATCWSGWSSQQNPSIAWNGNLYFQVRTYNTPYYYRFVKLTPSGTVTFLNNQSASENNREVQSFFLKNGNCYFIRDNNAKIVNGGTTTYVGKNCIYQITSSNAIQEIYPIGTVFTDGYNMNHLMLNKDYLPIYSTCVYNSSGREYQESLLEVVF